MILLTTRSASSEATTVWASTATIAAQKIFLSGRWYLSLMSFHNMHYKVKIDTGHFFIFSGTAKRDCYPRPKEDIVQFRGCLTTYCTHHPISWAKDWQTQLHQVHISLWAGEYRFLGQRGGVSSCADQPWRGQPQYRPQDDDDGGSDDNEYVGMLDRKSVSFMLKSYFYPFWKWGCWWWLWFKRWKQCWACTRSTRCLSEASLAR